MNYNELKESIKGPVYPIVTPFTDDYSVDYAAVKRYIDYLYEGGARIFHVMVHTSRFGLLTAEEQCTLNSVVCSYVKKNYSDAIAIAAGPFCGPTSQAKEYAVRAKDSGADVIGLYFSERYYSDDQLFDYFASVSSSVDIGILLHEQQLSTINFSKLMLFPETVLDRLADIENVVAIKEDSYEPAYTAKLISLLKDRLSIVVSGGSKRQFLDFAPSGCQAYLVGIASVFPEIATHFYAAYLDGDSERCEKIISDYEEPFFAATKPVGWHIGLKAAMESAGVMSATERPPLIPLWEEASRNVAAVTQRIQEGLAAL